MDGQDWWEQFAQWPLRNRLELLAFEAKLAGLPRPLIAALWEAIDCLAGDRRRQVPRQASAHPAQTPEGL
jgi:hypothetical protein